MDGSCLHTCRFALPCMLCASRGSAFQGPLHALIHDRILKFPCRAQQSYRPRTYCNISIHGYQSERNGTDLLPAGLLRGKQEKRGKSLNRKPPEIINKWYWPFLLLFNKVPMPMAWFSGYSLLCQLCCSVQSYCWCHAFPHWLHFWD